MDWKPWPKPAVQIHRGAQGERTRPAWGWAEALRSILQLRPCWGLWRICGKQADRDAKILCERMEDMLADVDYISLGDLDDGTGHVFDVMLTGAEVRLFRVENVNADRWFGVAGVQFTVESLR
jgi:hypothetical protein